ncbi:collagen-binding protein [Puia dinghuensis]|uniref:Collagen-binding protein n=2 Tax=Puia dinghuensis TaxID=1792502 RepID=A0A8J2UIT8_9BACT|nr:collagen-binding protein [Puia dinghuensis]
MITRNFDASKIARVQILDRKSEQAIFTGIDDGARTKTLNLVLKESAKGGYFGKLDVGGNTSNYYNVNGALASFRNKEQFTALGTIANTGVLGSSIKNIDASTYFLNGNTDALNASAGTGIPKFDAVALHYANTWHGPENHLASNYQYSHYFTQPMTDIQTLQIQPGNLYKQDQQAQSTNQQDQHWIYGIYNWAPNTRSAFNFSVYGTDSRSQNQFGSTETSSLSDTLVNTSLRTIQDTVIRQKIGSDISWRIVIGKRTDRVLSFRGSVAKLENTTNGYLYVLNHYYQVNGLIQSVDTIDQRKQFESHPITSEFSINFSEPLWKGVVLGLVYWQFQSGDNPLQMTWSRAGGKYDMIVDSLSSHFKTRIFNQSAAISLQGKVGILSYTMGNEWNAYSYRQQDLLVASGSHLSYLNWEPRLLLNFAINKETNLNFNYHTLTREPSITQLMPTKNNNDPLHLTLGNLNLKSDFSQTFGLNFHRFKTWLLDLALTMNLTSNSISTKTTTDSLGRQISQPVNVDGTRMAGINLTATRKVLGFDVGIHATGTYDRTVNYVNADLTVNDAYSGSGGFSLNRYVMDKYSFSLYTTFTYFDQVSSINISSPVRYWTQSHQGAMTLFFMRDFEINTNATYTWQQKTSAFSVNTSALLLNGYISRNFLHNKLVAKIQFNNILNNNAGIIRSNTANINTQSSTNILGRYWMLSATYHFDKKFRKK